MILPNTTPVSASICSAARSTVGGTAPDSSTKAATFAPCKPERVRPCSSALPAFGQLRGARNQVCGWSFAKIFCADQVNAAERNGERACHFDISAQKLSRRFCAVMPVTKPFGWSKPRPELAGVQRVARKYQAHIDIPAD